MILYRYITSELLKSMLAVTFTLLVIIMSGRLIKYLADVAAGELAPDFLFLIMLYRLPNFLEVILPLGLFIGILLSYGRLYVDSEIAVMNACGISRLQLLQLATVPILLVTVTVGLLSTVVTPAGIRAYERLLVESKGSDGLKAAVEGRFRLDHNSGRVTYIEKLNRENDGMSGVFIAQPMETDDGRILVSVIGADSGLFDRDEKTGQRYLLLDKGVRYVGQPGALDYQVARFERYGQWLQDETQSRGRKAADGKSTRELWESERIDDRAALQWRISLALLVPVVALLAVALSKTDHRSGRYAKMFPAFLLYMVYLIGLNAGREALASGELATVPGLWVIHAVFLLLGLLFLLGPDWVRRITGVKH
ncbi:LPS export ABC transporter permease LptF [Litorivivens sp.]|uniref:LPS export ABC transporter permease LptF n=1 Tax=Litorivivens sp. TaxID=2020868 RepID=UPI003562CA02